MGGVIKLSIQEIIRDFEELVRYDERLDVHFDFKKAKDEDILAFSKRMEELTMKYLPDSMDMLVKDVADDYERGLILYRTLHENFVEIFQKLV